MRKPRVFLAIHATSASGRNDRAYLDNLEDSVHNLAKKRPGLRSGTSSASEDQEGKWTESFVLVISDPESVDHVADMVVSEIRRVGLRKNVSITLSKRLDDPDSQEVYQSKVFSTRKTKWAVVSPRVGKSGSGSRTEAFPARLEYLARYANRYYLVGGNDVVAVFRQTPKLKEFLSSLSRGEVNDLRRIYRRIVSNKDHDWIMDWLTEDCGGNVSSEKAKTIYFLALLDRLCQGGLFAGVSRMTIIELVNWDRLA